jgi:hypothetical protein
MHKIHVQQRCCKSKNVLGEAPPTPKKFTFANDEKIVEQQTKNARNKKVSSITIKIYYNKGKTCLCYMRMQRMQQRPVSVTLLGKI